VSNLIDAEVIEHPTEFPRRRFMFIVYTNKSQVRVPFDHEAELGQALIAASQALRKNAVLTNS
jgi:hypothetical protein